MKRTQEIKAKRVARVTAYLEDYFSGNIKPLDSKVGFACSDRNGQYSFSEHHLLAALYKRIEDGKALELPNEDTSLVRTLMVNYMYSSAIECIAIILEHNVNPTNRETFLQLAIPHPAPAPY